MSLRHECLRMLGCFACLLAVSSSLGASEDGSEEPASLKSIRDETAQQIQQLSARRSAQGGSEAAVAVLEELALWRQVELIVAQRQTVADAAQLARNSDNTPDENVGPITRFLELDEARDELALAESRRASLEGEIASEHALMLEAKESLQQAQQQRRRFAEEVSAATDGSRSTWQVQQRLAAVRETLNQQRVALHRDTIAQITRRQQTIDSEITRRRDRIARAGSGIRLTKAELQEQLSRIVDMENSVRMQLANLDQQMHRFLLDTADPADAVAADTLGVIREESQLLRQVLSEIAAIRQCWQRRYQLSNQDGSSDDWVIWCEEARDSENRVAQIQERLDDRAMQRRQQVVAIRRQFAGAPLPEQVSAEIAQIEAIIDSYGNLRVLAEYARRTYRRFAEDLEARRGRTTLGGLIGWTGHKLAALWTYELAAVDDQSVTTGKLVTALLLLIVGLIIGKWFCSLIAFRVLPRFGFSHAAATTIRQMMIYALVVGMTMLSLNLVRVPLTIFAFLGGAAAIGVGFGSQNTVANFISGLILLIQGPIRIGDLVNVDGIDANVEHIGARATRVRTSENLEVLIPNSNILQNRVTNWTLSDNRIRTSVTVGVAYGTEVSPVIETLRTVVSQHPKVLTEPLPIVLFDDFGDSSLVFNVHFWIHMQTIMDGYEVRSEIRVAIDAAFRQAGIVIAFPQRDVHLDIQAPIEVALSEAKRPAARPVRRAA